MTIINVIEAIILIKCGIWLIYAISWAISGK